MGLLGLDGTSLPGWDFLARLGRLGLAWTSWPGWDFLAWLGLLGLAGIQKQKLHNPTMMEIAIYISSFANLFFYISGQNNLLLSVTYWLLFKLYMIFPGQHHNPFQCIKSFPWLIEILWWIWSFNTWCELSIQHLRTLITWRFLAATQYSLVIIYRVNTFDSSFYVS